MMGKEFAGALARFPHLTDLEVRPELVAICGRRLQPEVERWFRSIAPGIELATRDYREILARSDIEAVYIAVPHDLHAELYTAAIRSGKHVLGEKPFGIDAEANAAIRAAAAERPELVVRCASQFMYLPGAQRVARMLEAGAFGRIIEADLGFLHCSDLNLAKPINWKRRAETNGAYGVLGDLGMHTLPLPLRAGWRPLNVRALLSDIVTRRPNEEGTLQRCDTWDNATLLCEAVAPADAQAPAHPPEHGAEPAAGYAGQDEGAVQRFPLTIRAHRIAPGELNSWYIKVLGTRASAAFSTKEINRLWTLDYEPGGEQAWRGLDLGYESCFPAVSASSFEFGFSDALLQMWGAYFEEVVRGGVPRERFAGCFTPEETAVGHALFSAALRSQREGRVVPV